MTWKQTDTNYQTVLMALLAGAGAGLTVGLLMAPKSGDRLRGEIRDTMDEYLEAARSKADTLRTSAMDLAQRGLKQVQRTKDAATEKAKSAAENVAQQAQSAADTVRAGNAA